MEPNNCCRHYRQLFRTKLRRPVWLVLVLSLISGCQSFQYQTLLEKQVIVSDIVQSNHFRHRILRKSTAQPATPEVLHIYIEGDGRPWRARYFVASDPTPEYPLMLQAMLQDSTTSVYLGRPCYFHTNDPECTAMDWTMARYSESVVSSMTNIVDKLALDVPDLWLIGHSGGGALAVLIGRRLHRPVKVLTIAANLDHQAWTHYHGYSPLTESLNPMTELVRNPQMQEIHWYGQDDNNVLPAWILTYCRYLAVPCQETDASHAHGWLPQWHQILSESKSILQPQ